jgi:hypothetical protein
MRASFGRGRSWDAIETGVGGGAEGVDDIEVDKEDDRRAVYPNEGPGRVQPGFSPSPLSAEYVIHWECGSADREPRTCEPRTCGLYYY